MTKTPEEIEAAARAILKTHPGIEVVRFARKMGFPVDSRQRRSGEEIVFKLSDSAQKSIKGLEQTKVIELHHPAIRENALVYLFGQVPAKKPPPPKNPHQCVTTIDPYLKGTWIPHIKEEKPTSRAVSRSASKEISPMPQITIEPSVQKEEEPTPEAPVINSLTPASPEQPRERRTTKAMLSVRQTLETMVKLGQIWKRNQVCVKAKVSGSFFHNNPAMAEEHLAAIAKVNRGEGREEGYQEPSAAAKTKKPKAASGGKVDFLTQTRAEGLAMQSEIESLDRAIAQMQLDIQQGIERRKNLETKLEIINQLIATYIG